MHIKYKATDWDNIYGQDHIKDIVFHMELQSRCFLFTGEKGTGKSQMAFILARYFGCSEVNIQSIDCVHYTGVDAMREVLSSIVQPSVFNDKRALILDEPQELSHKAQETLLNPALNLPDNIIIIACSAKPEKFEEMAKDRFYILPTKLLDPKTSITFLNSILQQENIKLDKAKKAIIIKLSLGNPRRILKSIPIVTNTDSIDDINYLLVTSTMEDIGESVVKLFKLLLQNSQGTWPLINNTITDTLQTKSPNAIRAALLNLIGYRLQVGDIKPIIGNRLVFMADCLNNNNYPEKANLFIDICRIYSYE